MGELVRTNSNSREGFDPEANFPTLGELPDVDLTDLLDGYVIVFDEASSLWLARNANDHSHAGYQLIATMPIAISNSITVGVAQQFLDFQNIPTGWRHIQIRGVMRGDDAAEFQAARLQFNNDSAAVYDWAYQAGYADGSGPADGGAIAATSAVFGYAVCAGGPSEACTQFLINIYDYRRTTFKRGYTAEQHTHHGDAGAKVFDVRASGAYRDTSSPIDRVTLSLAAGNFDVGTSAQLYLFR